LKTVTYDTFTDQYFTPSVPINAAATKYMLAYTYGVCNNVLTKSVVEFSGTLDYSVQCEQQNGIYYQSPNVYYPLPLDCLGIPYDQLLTNCHAVAENMKSLVDTTCAKSIEKVCATQYNNNPPYTCTEDTRASILTVLSLTFSTTMVIIGAMAIMLTVYLTLMYPNHTAIAELHHEKEVELVNTGLVITNLSMSTKNANKTSVTGVLHEEEHAGLMEFCDTVAMKFGLETVHRRSKLQQKEEGEEEGEGNQKLLDEEGKDDDRQTTSQATDAGPRHSSRVSSLSNQSSYYQPDSHSRDSGYVPIDVRADNGSTAVMDVQLEKEKEEKEEVVRETSYKPIEIGIASDYPF